MSYMPSEFLKDKEQDIIMLAYLMMFGHAGISKLGPGETPSWFLNQFQESMLNVFQGSLSIQFFSIAAVEILVAGLALVGLFFRQKRDSYFRMTLLVSSFLFVGLSFGQRITGKFDSSATLFFYAMISLVLLKVFGEKANETQNANPN